MFETGRRVILVVRVPKTQLREDPSRRVVRRVVTGKERFSAEGVERVIDHRPRRFRGIPSSPIALSQVDPNLVDLFLCCVRSQAAAPHVLAGCEEKDRPVLDSVGSHRGDLSVESLLHLRVGKRPADESRNLGISPHGHGKIDVRVGPTAEPEALASEEEDGRRRFDGAI